MKNVHPIMAAVLAATLAPPQPQQPQRFEPGTWSHRCVAKKRTIFLALGKGCSSCGARERR